MKLLHAADLHLDSPFAGTAPEQAALRRAEQRDLIARLCEECRARGCELLLLAGDLFDGTHVYRDTLDALCQALAGCGAQVLIAPGNHDPLLPDSPYFSAPWPENVHIFTEQTPSAVEFPSLGCRVYGAGFRQERVGSLLEGFRAREDGLVNLMVLHGDATGGKDYNPVTPAQIAASGLRYLALGHIHRRGELRCGGTLCAWPGCAMGRGFDETGEKGALEVTLEDGRGELAFVPLGARRYEILECPAGADAQASVEAALPPGTERDLYRIILTGESPALDLPKLRDALQDRFYALELRDRTLPPIDLWAGAEEDTLRGRFLSRLKARYDAAPEAEREGVLFAVRTGLAYFDGREAPPL